MIQTYLNTSSLHYYCCGFLCEVNTYAHYLQREMRQKNKDHVLERDECRKCNTEDWNTSFPVYLSFLGCILNKTMTHLIFIVSKNSK